MRSAQFQALVARFPDNELHRFSLATALVAEGRAADAIEHFQRCCTKKADWMMPRIALGKALVGLGRKAEARPVLEEALQLAVEQEHETPEAELRGLLADLA